MKTLDCDSSGEKSSENRTEEEKNASGKGLLDGDGCGLLLGLVVEYQYCA
jgi:hypothetical protein